MQRAIPFYGPSLSLNRDIDQGPLTKTAEAMMNYKSSVVAHRSGLPGQSWLSSSSL